MRIFLQDDNSWHIHQDMLCKHSFAKYINSVKQIKRVYSEESILDILDENIKRVVVKDNTIEYGSIIHCKHHNYYHHTNDKKDMDCDDSEAIPIQEIPVVIDKSVITYDEVYHIPPQHVVEHITKYTISLKKKSQVKIVVEIINKQSHDLYFMLNNDSITADICSEIIQLFQLVKS